MEPKFKIGEKVRCKEHGTEFVIKKISRSHDGIYLYYKDNDSCIVGFHLIHDNWRGVPENLLEIVEDECPFKVGDWVKLVKGKDWFIRNECNPFFDETNIIGKILQIKIRNNNWCKPFNRCKYNIYVLWNNGIKNVYPEDALEKHEYKVGDKVEVKLRDGSWVENEISKFYDDGDIRLKDISYKLANNLNSYIESDNLDIIRPVQEKVYGESEINKHIESYLEKKENESTFTNVSTEPLTKEKLRECFYHDCVKPKVDMGVKGSFLYGDKVCKYVGRIKEIESSVIRLYDLNLYECDWNPKDWGCGINKDGYINSNGISGEYLTTLDGKLLNINGVDEEDKITEEFSIYKSIVGFVERNENFIKCEDGSFEFGINYNEIFKQQQEDKTMNFSICEYIEKIARIKYPGAMQVKKRNKLAKRLHENQGTINQMLVEKWIEEKTDEIIGMLDEIEKDN